MQRITLFVLFALTICNVVFCQHKLDIENGYGPKTDKVYHVNPLLEGGTAVLGMGATVYFFQKINDKDGFSNIELSRDDIPGIDRWALSKQPKNREKAQKASDAGFYPAIALPFTLFLSKKICKDWLDITSMYLQAQAANGLIYAVSPAGPNFTNRKRPVAYYPELHEDGEVSGKELNSFFSGHVSTTAVGSFFFAKVLSDYNPQWTGMQRALLFGAAAIPPAFVAVQRVRALRHFPTDTAIGFGVGAAIGILVPQMHKKWAKNHKSALNISGGYGNGVAAAGINLVF